MTQSSAIVGFVAPKQRFDLRQLAQIALWGVTAIVAVTLAAVASTTDAGEERMLRAIATIRGHTNPQTVKFADKRETMQLAEVVRALTADRERVTARLATLEQHVDGITGSIDRVPAKVVPMQAVPVQTVQIVPTPVVPQVSPQASPQPPAEVLPQAAVTPPVPLPVKPVHVPASQAVTLSPASRTALPMLLSTGPLSQPVSSATVWANVPLPQPAPDISPPDAAAEQVAAQQESPETPTAKTKFGVDLGAARNLEGLRALWAAARAKHAALATLRPVMTIRENRPGSIELRLVAGPIANAAGAARLCASLAGASCHPTIYDGQKLALR